MDALLLIGSDEAALRRLKVHFVRCGFRASAVPADDLDRLEGSKEHFLLGIVDGTGLPRVSDLVQKVRAKPACKEIPLLVVMKEAHLKELATLNGLEDFMMSPADPDLLEHRVRFVLKRLNHAAPGGEGIRIGKLKLDVDRYEVSLNEEPLELTYKEFELLKFLATHQGRVFSRDQLLNQVWGYDFIGGTRTVDVHVRRLRAKLGPKYASLIDTVRNVGYKFLEKL